MTVYPFAALGGPARRRGCRPSAVSNAIGAGLDIDTVRHILLPIGEGQKPGREGLNRFSFFGIA